MGEKTVSVYTNKNMEVEMTWACFENIHVTMITDLVTWRV